MIWLGPRPGRGEVGGVGVGLEEKRTHIVFEVIVSLHARVPREVVMVMVMFMVHGAWCMASGDGDGGLPRPGSATCWPSHSPLLIAGQPGRWPLWWCGGVVW